MLGLYKKASRQCQALCGRCVQPLFRQNRSIGQSVGPENILKQAEPNARGLYRTDVLPGEVCRMFVFWAVYRRNTGRPPRMRATDLGVNRARYVQCACTRIRINPTIQLTKCIYAADLKNVNGCSEVLRRFHAAFICEKVIKSATVSGAGNCFPEASSD